MPGPAAAERRAGRSARGGRRPSGRTAPGPAGRRRGRRPAPGPTSSSFTSANRRARLEVGLAGRAPRASGPRRPGPGPRGPGPGSRRRPSTGQELLVSPGRVAGPLRRSSVEPGQGEPGVGDDPGRRVAPADVFQQPRVALPPAPGPGARPPRGRSRRRGSGPLARGAGRPAGRRSGGRPGSSGGRRRRRRSGPGAARRPGATGGSRPTTWARPGRAGPRPVRAGRPGDPGPLGRRRRRRRTGGRPRPSSPASSGLLAELHQEPPLVVAGGLDHRDAVDVLGRPPLGQGEFRGCPGPGRRGRSPRRPGPAGSSSTACSGARAISSR